MNDSRYASFRAASGGPGLPPQRQVSDHRCGCGCGGFTLVAYRTRGRDGARKGEPLQFINGHNSWHRALRPTCRPCNPATLAVCAGCDTTMHLSSHNQRTCAAGHPSMTGRTLCVSCYYQATRAGTLADFPRRLRSRDELLEEWEWLAAAGVGFAEFPARVGVTFAAWQRAFLRARADGDLRAVRFDKGEEVAA